MADKFKDRLRGLATVDPAAAAAAEREAQDFERRRRHGALERRADETGVPRESDLRRVCFFDSVVETDAMRAVAAALAWRAARTTEYGSQRCVRVLGGDVGCGKTIALARAIVRHDRPAAFVTAVEVVATPRNGFSGNEEKWDRWLTVDLLGLDDAGTEAGDPGVIRGLLVQRYDRGLATLVSSNLTKGEFRVRFLDQRLSDRLTAGQRGTDGVDLGWFVGITGASLRDPSALAALARRAA